MVTQTLPWAGYKPQGCICGFVMRESIPPMPPFLFHHTHMHLMDTHMCRTRLSLGSSQVQAFPSSSTHLVFHAGTGNSIRKALLLGQVVEDLLYHRQVAMPYCNVKRALSSLPMETKDERQPPPV